MRNQIRNAISKSGLRKKLTRSEYHYENDGYNHLPFDTKNKLAFDIKFTLFCLTGVGIPVGSLFLFYILVYIYQNGKKQKV